METVSIEPDESRRVKSNERKRKSSLELQQMPKPGPKQAKRKGGILYTEAEQCHVEKFVI